MILRQSFLFPLLIGVLAKYGIAQDEPPVAQHDVITAMKALTLAPGIKVDLFAAEPQVANPVAISVDELGRVYVCETYRQSKGVEDNRDHPEWVDDDLAAKTVQDRLAVYKKYLKANIKAYSQHEDRIRYLEDRDGDGRADVSRVFVGGFNGPLEGTGAGILARQGTVYYTCIPRLWVFHDDDGDGQADRRAALHDGFGVRVAFRGHDLHGCTLGPDGRLYFSLGDRGFHVDTGDKTFANPETGAIFRCDMDGKKLEVFATGFRNPQDLTFDAYGNLFTCDNNSDSGDRARWLHVLPGADYGWRMAFQYLPDRGPWNSESLWRPYFPGQSAAVTPPIANMADGPSGLVYYPGTGLAEHYNGNFFLCDFRGSAALSGIRTFKHKPRGASYEVIDPEVFLWQSLATDLDFGPDGILYVCDWVEGWNGVNKGRIWRLYDEQAQASETVKEVHNLLSAGLKKTNIDRLAKLLEHPNYRVRREAHFELASRGAIDALDGVVRDSTDQFARLHAIWGLGQIARSFHEKNAARALEVVAARLRDVDAEIRAAAATVVGEASRKASERELIQLLKDNSPRVRAAVAMALAKLGTKDAIDGFVDLLAGSPNEDFVLRHVAILGLTKCASEKDLIALHDHPIASVRLGAVVALRRQGRASIAEFLDDNDELVVTEAARAIYDEPIEVAMPRLAALAQKQRVMQPLMRRILAANFRLGEPENAQRIADIASDDGQVIIMRLEALKLLSSWASPPSRDTLLGMWRPLQPRHKQVAIDVVRENLPKFLRSKFEIRTQAAMLASSLGIHEVGPILKDMLWNEKMPGRERAGVLLALGNLRPTDLPSTLEKAVHDVEPRVRAAARIVLSRTDPEAALNELNVALQQSSPLEQQSAVRLLPNLASKGGDAALIEQLEKLNAGEVAAFLRLDVFMAARRRVAENANIKKLLDEYLLQRPTDDPLADYHDTLQGGNAERGELLFRASLALSCLRCHRVGDAGGRIGPDLSKVAQDKSREYLLESIVLPNKNIARGYETTILETDDGQTIAGIVQQEKHGVVELLTAEGKTLSFTEDEIEARTTGKSAMPEVLPHMTLFDLRDLVEYMATLK